jgi:hypothetical protein
MTTEGWRSLGFQRKLDIIREVTVSLQEDIEDKDFKSTTRKLEIGAMLWAIRDRLNSLEIEAKHFCRLD